MSRDQMSPDRHWNLSLFGKNSQYSAKCISHFWQNCTKQALRTHSQLPLNMMLLSNYSKTRLNPLCKDWPNDRLPAVLSKAHVSIYFWLKFSRFTLRYVIKVITLLESDNINTTSSCCCSLTDQLKALINQTHKQTTNKKQKEHATNQQTVSSAHRSFGKHEILFYMRRT